VIEEVGSHVTEFRVGDEVYYTPQIFGGQAHTPSSTSPTSASSAASPRISVTWRPRA
jgi:NADPH:quinone reductase-like Zn-dependent oxidoreductase